MVRVVSKEFEKVLVEQYHCHGLRTVIQSWRQKSMGCPRRIIHGLATYSSPWNIALIAKDGGCQSPSIKVTQGGKDRLDNLGQGFENKRLESGRKERGQEPMGSLVCQTKDGRMERGAELMLPFPGQPSTALVSKG